MFFNRVPHGASGGEDAANEHHEGRFQGVDPVVLPGPLADARGSVTAGVTRSWSYGIGTVYLFCGVSQVARIKASR